MISIKDLEKMSNSSLICIYRTLNCWQWHELLGEKPGGWDDMPNYKKPHMGECLTKADVVRPYMRKITQTIPMEDIYPSRTESWF